jgi:hypothetical protein
MGALGYDFPTALGVKVARPDVPVISVISVSVKHRTLAASRQACEHSLNTYV